MLTWEKISQPQLDIVGIVAVLGEGSTYRNAQASAAGWHHLLPRLLPAPQALLKHEHEKRLPTVAGTVVGAYSGNVKFELNFFCQLLHKDDLPKNAVELVQVTSRDGAVSQSPYVRLKKWLQERERKKNEKLKKKGDTEKHHHHHHHTKHRETAYDVKALSPLALLSILGCMMSIGLIIGSIVLEDGFACMATLLLSLTSSIVGFASRWTLNFKEDPPQENTVRKGRKNAIPDSDVVIFYPRQGAFRIIRCSEEVSRLYFRTEECQHTFDDDWYRILALVSSICLMAGLLCLSNSNTPMQIAFAASYISLNALHWGVSALDPTGNWGHWKHKYDCTPLPFTSTLPEVKRSIPQRSDTEQSASQNRAVYTSEPLSQTQESLTSSGGNGHITNGPTVASPKPSLNVVTSDSQTPGNFASKLQRRVTFRNDPTMSSMSALRPVQTAPETRTNQGKSNSPTAARAWSEVQEKSIPLTKLKKVMTFDIEALKARLSRPGGSIHDQLPNLFNGAPVKVAPPDQQPKTVTVKEIEIVAPNTRQEKISFTTALWKAIALTGTARWLNQTHIAPDNEVWKAWITFAGKRAEPREKKGTGELVAAATLGEDGETIQLPPWDCEAKLSELFEEAKEKDKRRPPKPPKLLNVVLQQRENLGTVKGISPIIEKRLLRKVMTARQKADAARLRRSSITLTPGRSQTDGARLVPRESNIKRQDFVRTTSAN